MRCYLYALFFVFCTSWLHAQVVNGECILKKEWDAFSSQYPALVEFSSDEIAVIANQWGKKIAEILSVSETIREVDPVVVDKLLTILQEDEPRIFMRHGEQQKTERIQQLPAVEQKIEMMRLPDNIENALTKASLVEWMEGMIVWEYLKQKTGRHFFLESSKNRRAELPADLLGYALKTDVSINENLNCVNYSPNNKMSTSEILKWLPDGTLPWNQQKVDAVVGPGTYEHMIQEMEKLLCSSMDADTIFIAITHTQQTNAIAVLSGLPVIRLGNFGFMLLTDRHKEVFPEGFYKKN
jgi:hypothetical protein